MNIVTLHKHNFPHRRTTESQSEFTAKYMSIEHASILKEISEKNNLDFEVATGYAMAMFCAMEDLMLSHHNIDFPGFSISVKVSGKQAVKKIKAWRAKLSEPWQRNITALHDDVKANLIKQHERDNLNTSRLEEKRTGKVFFSEDDKQKFLIADRKRKSDKMIQSESYQNHLAWLRAMTVWRRNEAKRKRKIVNKRKWEMWALQKNREHFSY